MRKSIFINMFVLLSVVLAACGSAAPPPDTTSSKQVNIAVRTDPNPAMKGDMELILAITDANGNPLEGATVDVAVDHTDMTGMGMSGPATDQGSGRYSIKANFEMSGNWKMTIYVRKGELDYQEDIQLQVQ